MYKQNTQLEKLILKYPNKSWKWKSISQNPNITMLFIENNQNKPWRWDCISYNPNLTIEFGNKYPIVKFLA